MLIHYEGEGAVARGYRQWQRSLGHALLPAVIDNDNEALDMQKVSCKNNLPGCSSGTMQSRSGSSRKGLQSSGRPEESCLRTKSVLCCDDVVTQSFR